MLIGDTSKYYLKKVRAKAKLYEYHIPESLHGTTEKEVNQLIISAIAIIGDFSDRIIDSFKGVDFLTQIIRRIYNLLPGFLMDL